MKFFKTLLILTVLFSTGILFAQSVKLGPRLTGNLNIYNAKGLTGTWNGIGIGAGGTVDVSFNQHIGIMANVTVFDMKGFSNSTTAGNVTYETSLSLSYLTIDPMFKGEFSGFYMVGGPSIGIKLNSSGEQTAIITGGTATPQPINVDTKSIRFDIAFGTGYTFHIDNNIYLGSDFMVYIPVTDTYNTPGVSNSVLSLKLGVALKFKI